MDDEILTIRCAIVRWVAYSTTLWALVGLAVGALVLR